jgi:hypothetical protein
MIVSAMAADEYGFSMAVGRVVSKSISLAQVGFTTTRTMPWWSDFTLSSLGGARDAYWTGCVATAIRN